MKRLRIGLPPLDQLNAESRVRFAWVDRGVVVEEGTESLTQLCKARGAVECYLHPRDSLLTSLELPPLPAAKTAAAVACAAQALILGPVDQMHVAHGPRERDGRVQVAWVSKAGLENLARLPFKLRGLYPAPYALPVGAATLDEGYLLTRDSLQQGSVHPLGQQALDVPQVDAAQRWSGPAPAWSLHGRVSQAASGGWGRALACVALATAVWTLGLNLYAARQADEGQRLKALLNQQVRQAFPELPVVLNPLQQARQQLAARQAGTGQGFTHLLQSVGSQLPFMVASVESLTFEQGQLHLELVAESRHPTAEGDWQAALTQAGFTASRDDHGWRIGPLQPGASDE